MRFEHGESRYSRYTRASKSQSKRLVIYAVLLVGVVVAMIALRQKVESPAPQAGPIKWLLTFEEATAQAKAKDWPIMAYFFVEGNEDCKRMDTVTFADPTVRAEAGKFICVRIDGKAHPDLAKRYLQLEVYPSTAFIAPGGRLLLAAYNARRPDHFLDEIRRALKVRKQIAGSDEQPATADEPDSGALDESPSLPPRNADPSRGGAE